MASKELDRIDRKIIEVLQFDGRITNQDLSEKVALSPRACLERVRRLERSGLITAYMALVDPRKLGGLLTIVVEVTLKDQTQATHARFEQRMKGATEVVECFLVSGQCDYVLRLACRNLDHYRELTNAWTDDPALGVEKITSKPELQTIKPFRGYPLP
jgi:Lrp/AsnC family transcriptional regulator, leucine-responsive regulatory protein